MNLQALKTEHFRNIDTIEFTPSETTNVISGKNGQGKTNLLESIWLLTGAKSFRGSKDIEIVKENEEFSHICGMIKEQETKASIDIFVPSIKSEKRGRSAKLNGVPYARASMLAGKFTAVVFEPGHLSLVKGSPEGRRRFLDATLCQIWPGYLAILRRFTRSLRQKNALLKKYYQTQQADMMLDVFDEELAQTGQEIRLRRQAYLIACSDYAKQVYSELTMGTEYLDMQFVPNGTQEDLQRLYQETRKRDIKAGFSTSGPHRDDFISQINGRDAKIYASQGQQRSIVLSLKLAEASYILDKTGQYPVMLFDDVLSELDEVRQSYLLNCIQDKQTFITTCDTTAFGKTNGKILLIKEGQLLEP